MLRPLTVRVTGRPRFRRSLIRGNKSVSSRGELAVMGKAVLLVGSSLRTVR